MLLRVHGCPVLQARCAANPLRQLARSPPPPKPGITEPPAPPPKKSAGRRCLDVFAFKNVGRAGAGGGGS